MSHIRTTSAATELAVNWPQRVLGSPLPTDEVGHGRARLGPEYTYPLTGVACVSRVYTDAAVFDLGPEGATVGETFGISIDDLWERVGVPLIDSKSSVH